MTHSTKYKGHKLHAYLQQTFPSYRDPYATGPRRYPAVVRIEIIPADESSARRYTTQFKEDNPTCVVDAIDLALQ